MRACRVIVPKSYLAEKLGIEENQFVIADISGSNDIVEFTLFIDENAITETELTISDYESGSGLLRRQRIE